MDPISLFLFLADLIYGSYSRMRAGSWTRTAVLEWAAREDYKLYRLVRDKSPESGPGYCYLVEAVDSQHVRRTGRVRVHQNDGWSIELTWLAARQLDWRDQPPRGEPPASDGTAQGWHTDPSGRHELRWYSAGTPTSLVKDGAMEGHDAP